MDAKLEDWIARKTHLPPILRGEANQAKLFEVIHKSYAAPDTLIKMNWPTETSGRVFIMEGFLPFMARFGYTLQQKDTGKSPLQIKEWREQGKHLPKIMRDFHAQKDLIRTLFEELEAANKAPQDFNWVEGHCYLMDWVLWYLARNGFILRRSSRKLPFEDLREYLDATGYARLDKFIQILEGEKKPQEAA